MEPNSPENNNLTNVSGSGNNDLIKEKLGWEYSMTLEEGIRKTYGWISWEASKEIYSDKNIVGMNVV